MARVCDIRDFFEFKVPSSLKMEFDNVGFLAGFSQKKVNRALVALDITIEVAKEAESLGAELIVSHHPLFFSAKTITDEDRVGRAAITLLQAGMSAICLHTNLDAVSGGVNDALIKKLGARPECALAGGKNDTYDGVCGIGRVGELDRETPFFEFLVAVKKALGTNGLRYFDAGKTVKRLAVLGGSGGEYIEAAVKSGCDTFVTADVKYDRFLDAKALGINLIDGDHFCTENVVVPVIADMLREGFPEIDTLVSKAHGQPASFYV